jgi:hypothetical protein
VNARPRFVRLARDIPLSVGYRPLKHPLREHIPAQGEPDLLGYDHELHLYETVESERFVAIVAQARSLEETLPAIPVHDDEPAAEEHDLWPAP